VNGEDNLPAGIGTVKWSWLDDDGRIHTHLFEALYFPQSPVNILSVTQFALKLKDPDKTRISTGMLESEFTWDHGRYRRRVVHPESGLPELPVNLGYSRFRTFCSLVGSYFPKPRFAFCSAHTNTPAARGIAVQSNSEGTTFLDVNDESNRLATDSGSHLCVSDGSPSPLLDTVPHFQVGEILRMDDEHAASIFAQVRSI
jgi:hypothetical protein